MIGTLDEILRIKRIPLKMSFAERVLYWTIVLTPLWWLLGIQPLFYPAIAIGLLIFSFDFDTLIRKPLPVCVWAWLAMALAMLWTAMLGLSDLGFNLTKVASTLVTFFKGYFLIFACLALPFWNRISPRLITRAIAWMAVGYLVTISIQLVLLAAGFDVRPLYPPLARLTPGNKLSLIVNFTAGLQPFFGIPLPRSSLYMGDPPIPGICGLLSFLICLGEPNPRLRGLALAGSFSALVVSQSRLAWVCFLIAIAIYSSFRNFLAREASLWLFSFTALLCSLKEWTLSDLLSKPLAVFHKARPASSTDREFVVRKTLEAWQESPWLGWGIAQDSANWYNYNITLGSFSSYAGVLYLHGIFGFTVFITALVATLVSYWKSATEGNLLSQRAIAGLVALSLFIHGLPLSWIAVHLWFFFVWLGAILSEVQEIASANAKKHGISKFSTKETQINLSKVSG